MSEQRELTGFRAFYVVDGIEMADPRELLYLRSMRDAFARSAADRMGKHCADSMGISEGYFSKLKASNDMKLSQFVAFMKATGNFLPLQYLAQTFGLELIPARQPAAQQEPKDSQRAVNW